MAEFRLAMANTKQNVVKELEVIICKLELNALKSVTFKSV
jgi:hypothetical protein